MLSVHHFLSTLTIGGTQYGVFIYLVEHEDTHMIKTKLVTDYVCGQWQNFFQVSNGSDNLGNLCHGFKLVGTLLNSLVRVFQIFCSLCQFVSSFSNDLLQRCTKFLKFAITTKELFFTFTRSHESHV